MSTEHAHRLEVWNLCSLADARRAERAHDSEPDVAAAVRAAARSSGPARLTALHIAALDGVPELAVILLRLGAAINARSKSGATALFAACEAGHAPVVRTLLQAGADMWIPTASHENCLYIAALKGNSEVRCCRAPRVVDPPALPQVHTRVLVAAGMQGSAGKHSLVVVMSVLSSHYRLCVT